MPISFQISLPTLLSIIVAILLITVSSFGISNAVNNSCDNKLNSNYFKALLECQR